MSSTHLGYAQVVRDFYRAVAGNDAAAIEEVIRARFADDVAITWPPSLPYGGTITGAAKLVRMFSRMAASPEPVGAAGVVVSSVVDGGDQVAAQLEFDWYPRGSAESIRTGALELWSFGAGRVREIRAYYWDTAACAEAAAASALTSRP